MDKTEATGDQLGQKAGAAAVAAVQQDAQTTPATGPKPPAPSDRAGMLGRVTSLWRDLVGRWTEPGLDRIAPHLPDPDRDLIRQLMVDCLEGKGGDVSARARAVALGQAYVTLDATGRHRFLGLLAEDFAANHKAVAQAAAEMVAAHEAGDSGQVALAEAALRRSLKAPRQHLLRQFNALPDGVKFLVEMRSEVMDGLRQDRSLAGVDRDLKNLLKDWFDVGFLELKRITWASPAAFLEKVISYEAVHAIQSWTDLKNRLDRDRRLYAFVHPRMPDEPLIFVEVALVSGMADSVSVLLDQTAPVIDPQTADTAVFYSISNCQEGLRGITLGNFLIKTVVEQLRSVFPGLKTYCTLSPVPGFRSWLSQRLAEGDRDLLLPGERKALKALGDGGPKGVLRQYAEDPASVFVDPTHEAALKQPLMRLCARYLAVEKRPPRGDVATQGMGSQPLDAVARFHLANGARMERLNWAADRSEKGLDQSFGLMINYVYALDEIEKNHEAFQEEGKVVCGNAFQKLVKGG